MFKKTLMIAAAAAALGGSHPAMAAPTACNLTTCASASITIVANGPCTGGGLFGYSCPWRVNWTAGATSPLPGSMSYSYSTPSTGGSGTCSWTTGGCTPPRTGERTGSVSNVGCAGYNASASISNTATAGTSVTANDFRTVHLQPPITC